MGAIAHISGKDQQRYQKNRILKMFRSSCRIDNKYCKTDCPPSQEVSFKFHSELQVLSFNDSFSLIETDLERSMRIWNGWKAKGLGNFYMTKTEQHQIDQERRLMIYLAVIKVINSQNLFLMNLSLQSKKVAGTHFFPLYTDFPKKKGSDKVYVT